jgi:hypothetical protein
MRIGDYLYFVPDTEDGLWLFVAVVLIRAYFAENRINSQLTAALGKPIKLYFDSGALRSSTNSAASWQ